LHINRLMCNIICNALHTVLEVILHNITHVPDDVQWSTHDIAHQPIDV